MGGPAILWALHGLASGAPSAPRGCVQPGLGAGPGLAAAAPRPNLDAPTGLYSDVVPAVVWYDATHPNSVAIAPQVLAVLERSWDVQVRQIGFRAPVLPDAADGPELDVYLADYQPFGAFVAPDDEVDHTPGDGFNGTSTFVVVDRELPLAFVPAWVSHEFNHVLQFATDFTEPSLAFWEGTATAAQDWTVGAEQGRWDQDVASFQEVPEASALTADSYTIWPVLGRGESYEYGAAFWVMYLDQVLVGANPGVGAAQLWEAAANEGPGREPDVVDAVAEIAGMGLGEVLDAFAVARVLTGADWDPRGVPDARAWQGDERVVRSLVPASALPLAEVPLVPAPQILGQGFVDVDLSGGVPAAAGLAEPWVVIEAGSASGLGTGLAVLSWDAAGFGADVDAVGDAPEIALPLADLQRLVIAVTNLGPPGWDGDDDPYVPGDHRLSVRLEDRGPGATGTETTSSLPDADDGPPPAAEPEGCGCTTGAGAPSGALLGLGALLVRRRRAVVALGAAAGASLACGGAAPAPAEPVPYAAPPVGLVYTAPSGSFQLGRCAGAVPNGVPLDAVGLDAAKLAAGAPCASADYDGDGAADFALARPEAASCTHHHEVDLLWLRGPGLAEAVHVRDAEAGGCPEPGSFEDRPAVFFRGEGSGDWAVVWRDGAPKVVLAASGD